ncbi:MAG: thermonuclease family protein [Enhygromyxa sp.]
MARRFDVIVAGVACALLSGCVDFGGPLVGDGADDSALETGADDSGEDRCGPRTGVVHHVVDGDTIVLTSGQRVRYLLIDTPEITEGKNECWGTQAAEHNAALVEHQSVTLTYDVECEDVYGRLLAYVSVEGLEVNRELIENGSACLLHIPPNGNGKVAEYQALEDAARQAKLGMWGACGTVYCD